MAVEETVERVQGSERPDVITAAMTTGVRLPHSLPNLPIEIAHSIFRYLNPISLISLSQTNTYFRREIYPGRNEFLERLLELECHTEFGGNLPHTCSVQNRAQNGLPQGVDTWKKMRWACSGCLKLLPHTHFDNHSLLGLCYRKPKPGSPAAGLYTSWMPSLHGKKRNQRDILQMAYEQKPCVGFKRSFRLCNECRYQTKKLGKRPAYHGPHGIIDTFVAIQKSRKVSFNSSLERFFPGYSDRMENKRPHFEIPVFHIVREEEVFENYWTTYMVRCPQCESWKELRNFRVGEPNPHMSFATIRNYPRRWSESSFLDRYTICNSCFARVNGLKKLSTALIEWFRIIHDYEVCIISRHCTLGLSPIARVRQHPDFRLLQCQHRREIRHILAQGRRFEGDNSGLLREVDLSYCRIMHTRISELLRDIDKASPEMNYLVRNEDFLQIWLDYFDELEAYWLWLRRTMEEVEEDPLVLVDWALNYDGASLK